jgi:type I restriction enzyme S subunit
MDQNNLQIPNGWIEAELIEIVERLQYGHTAKALPEIREPKFLRITDIQDNDVEWSTVPGCQISEEELERYKLEEGDIVFARSGSLEKAYRVSKPPLAVFASYLIRGKPLHKNLSYYLKHFVRSQSYLRQIGAYGSGIAIQNVNAKKLGSVKVPIPPLNEQKRIIAKIEELQSHSRRTEEALETIPDLLQQLRQSILASAFRGDLTKKWREQHKNQIEPATELLKRIRIERRKRWEESELDKLRSKGLTGDKLDTQFTKRCKQYKEPDRVDTRDLPDSPEGWCWTTLGEAFEVFVGATPSRKVPDYWGGGIHWVSSGEVAWNRINKTVETITDLGLSKTSTCLHPPGTVLLGMIGEGKTRGQAAILNIEACNNQNSAAIRVSQTEIPPEYIYWFLIFQYENTRLGSMGNNQPALNKGKVESIPFPLLPLKEMGFLVDRIKKEIDKITNLEAILKELTSTISILDQSILHKGFSGELVNQDPNDEPASILLERIQKACAKEKIILHKRKTEGRRP